MFCFTNEQFKSSFIIQKCYLGMKVRQKLRLFKNLPIDLQKKIIFHMRENSLIKKHHHDVIENIIYKKTHHYMIYELRPWLKGNKGTSILNDKHILKTISLLELYVKYFFILTKKNKLKHVYEYCNLIATSCFNKNYYNNFLNIFNTYKKCLLTN